MEEDDLIVVVVDEKNGQNHQIYLGDDVNIKVEPAEITEIDIEQQKEIMNLISSGYGQYIKPEVEDNIDDDDLDEDYLPEELSSDENIDEDINDEDDGKDLKQKSKEKKVPGRKGPNSMNNSGVWVSYVNHIRLDNPQKEDDEEAMIQLIVEEMKSVKPPENDGSWFTHLGLEKYRCNVCTSIKATNAEVTKHYLNQHGPRYLVCLACGADFRCTTNLYKHEKRCLAPDAKLVLKARALCIGNRARCGSAYKPVHQIKRFTCSLCPAAYMAKTSLLAHERLHRAERPFKCEYCDRSYTCKAVLMKHKLVHEDGAFACDYCGRTFKYKTALSSHIYSHSGVPRFPCRECDRRFTYKAALQLHVHSKHRHMPPLCACKICPKRFARMWALKDHMKKAHGLLLMTRRMFFKQLPTMSETMIKEARVVLRSEVPIIHPSDINIDLPPENPSPEPQTNKRQSKPSCVEEFLDEKSGQIVGDTEPADYPQLHIKDETGGENHSDTEIITETPNSTAQNVKNKQIVNNIIEIVNNEEIEMQEVADTEETEENYLRIVLLDDSVVDYTELVNNYHLTGNKNSNIVVIENGKVKEISDEELKTYEESINGIQP